MLFMLIVTVLLVWLLRFFLNLALKEQKYRQQLNGLAPNVSDVPIIGALWQMRDFQPDNLHEKFAEYVQRYGRSFVATTCGRMVLVTAEPHLVETLLLSKQQLRKSIVYGALRGWLGDGLLLSRGERWHSMRKIITPTFHFNILEQYIDVFDRQCNVLVEKLKPLANDQQAINIYPYMGLMALDIIGEAAMGVSINAQLDVDSPVVQAVKDVTNTLATRFVRPLLLHPTLFRYCWPSGYRKQVAAVQLLRNFTDNIIERRRHQLLQQQEQQQKKEQELPKRAALLDTLLQARYADAPLTDVQIRDEVSTFIFEGHDTTTSAASFCLYLLSRHAAVQQRLFEELHTHYGCDLQRPVVYSDFVELTYLHVVVKESLRLFPPIPAVGRCLEKDLVIGDSILPSGTNVILLLWQLLRDEKFYEDPERFWPERHLATNKTNEGFSSYIPFSAGPRNCIGQRFALLELKTIVIKVLRQFELLPQGKEIKPSIKLVLRSATGVNLGLKTRVYT
ncbi:cytochrome P450 4ae1 [Drosophila sulfurigaster albostrigata]|uniref:cytochrome P450 4ae1 n=1 Tax=Drosophila sulfurigaster albostrigata TaxID=89887 RepID=UPI002D21A2B3|nr:cytochrome P450 4ae1 [Drosophila sulfurigaster albostrigata]XP_062140972.1 cytochrome P450 4ae1 [Drosophila sulfurigaster albostrigata]XP_062140973.1 cytochrome P450 4ae1 [Drosophila sulfurigaster albostrigata]XP_062140974.1 cytochrome P450 4ae1 [Drosophila sulfurigaster albostrigata]